MESLHEPCDSRFSNGSFSCLCPSVALVDSYDKLPQQPLGLVVVKLDGSSFGIEVARTGTIGELRRAVESAFSYLPKNGAGRVSWSHVWSQFCLCYKGQMLLADSDSIRFFGIKDGDELQFTHHVTDSRILSRAEKAELEETDSDDEPCVSDNQRKRPQLQMDVKGDGRSRENRDDDEAKWDNGMVRCAVNFGNLFIGCPRYQSLSGSSTASKTDERKNSSRHPHKKFWRLSNYLRFSRSKHRFQRLIRKRE